MHLTRDGLIAAYHSYGKPSDRWRVGAEFERHLLDERGAPLPYHGEPGVRWLMLRLAELGGWEPTLEADQPIALGRGQARVTLEPGGQLELSGSPFDDVSGVDTELAAFNERVDALLEGTGYHQVALGFTPFAEIPDIPWVPKGRYSVMRDYLKQTGELAHHMMKGTCATQASYDFADEADCGRKVRLATRLGPLTTAIFANSPLASGRPAGWASWRGHIWTRTDARRTGFPEAATDFDFEKWVDYLLDVPMMFIKRNGTYEWANGRTFADWMTDPVDPPSEADWDLHLTSVFPEVRIKQTIEVRGADCVARPLQMAFAALFEGLFYCGQARDQADDLTDRFIACGTKDERFEIACRHGLAGTIGDRRVAAWAEDLLEIAGASLDRCRPGDRRWLAPLIEVVATGESPAAAVLRDWEADPDPGRFVRRQHVDGHRPSPRAAG